MDKVPITFAHEGQQYSGTLDQVQGAGASNVWHLTIGKSYKGRLRRYNDSWAFDPAPKDEWLAGFANFFGEHVDAEDG